MFMWLEAWFEAWFDPFFRWFEIWFDENFVAAIWFEIWFDKIRRLVAWFEIWFDESLNYPIWFVAWFDNFSALRFDLRLDLKNFWLPDLAWGLIWFLKRRLVHSYCGRSSTCGPSCRATSRHTAPHHARLRSGRRSLVCWILFSWKLQDGFWLWATTAGRPPEANSGKVSRWWTDFEGLLF